MADTLTKNFKFVKPAFNKKPWQQSFYDSMDAIDAILARYILVSNFVGVWNQATAYTAGQRVVDTVGGAIYTCNVNHTSTAINTFAQDRIANPSFWTIFTFSVQFRGTWVTNTDYSTGDFVVFGQKLAVANSTHHSSASFIVDQANGLWNVLIDGTAVAALPTGTAANADQTIRYDGVSLQYQLTSSLKVSSAGVTTLPAGAVGAPSLNFNAQGGFYSPGANLVALTVGGVEIWRQKNDGTATLAFPDAFRQGLGFPAAAAANIGRTIGWDNVTGLTLVSQGPLTGFRNRIINGDMRIDQRNNGGAVTPASTTYTLDRWAVGLTQANKLSVQQVTAPTGFTGFDKAAKLTVLLNYSSLAGDAFFLKTTVEGNNVSDLAWGTAAAKSVVLSFWAQASVTGTYGLGLRNNASNRTYTAQYIISAANTPTFIVIVIPGDTSGTWLVDNTIGIELDWDLGSGTNFEGVANTWQAASALMRVAGNVAFVASAAATWQVSGVQLEAGAVPTAFEKRAIATDIALCQRYYETGFWQLLQAAGGLVPIGGSVQFKVYKRAVPTMAGTPSGLSNVSGGTVDSPFVDSFRAWFTATATTSNSGNIAWTATAEL